MSQERKCHSLTTSGIRMCGPGTYGAALSVGRSSTLVIVNEEHTLSWHTVPLWHVWCTSLADEVGHRCSLRQEQRLQLKRVEGRPTCSMALGTRDCDLASAQSRVRQRAGAWARGARCRPAQGPWARLPGRAEWSDGGCPSRVGYRREAPLVLVDRNRVSDPPPVGGEWARA